VTRRVRRGTERTRKKNAAWNKVPEVKPAEVGHDPTTCP
jgi:hypothetical protein